jgi:hypothetical protein
MMSVKNYILPVFFCLFAFSCISPPDNFPTVPEISFREMRFVPTNSADSLIISIDFKDAEGDLGLNATDIDPPFNPVLFRRNAQGNLIFYRERPANAPLYNPLDWIINPLVNNTTVRDTVWIEQNPNHNNIFIKFFIKRAGSYSEFRWEDPPFFTTFNGRFPRMLNSNASQAVEGRIDYAMLSFGWPSIFRNDTIRVDVFIQDRALNKSNVVSSPEVTLNQITRR